MKSILYVGATLMIGASIYGFVDYKKTSHDKEFTTMYDEKTVAEPVAGEDLNVITNEKEIVVKKETSGKEKKTVTKKQVVTKKEEEKQDDIDKVDIKPVADDERVAVTEKKTIEKSAVDIKPSKNSIAEKKVTKKRKFSTKLFSRGALDERYVEPKEKVKTSKDKEENKTEDKEQ